MTNNVVIALSCGTNDTNRATRAIHLATIASGPPPGMWQMIFWPIFRPMRSRSWCARLVPLPGRSRKKI